MACEDKQFNQMAIPVGLLGDSIDGVDLVSLLETIASLPLRCGVFKQYGRVIAAITSMMVLTPVVASFSDHTGDCKLFVDHICDDPCPGEIQRTQLDRNRLLATQCFGILGGLS